MLPLAVLVQVTPIIAYAPAIVIWLGFGLKPILIITSLVCFVPFLINGVTGLRSVDPEPARAGPLGRRQPARDLLPPAPAVGAAVPVLRRAHRRRPGADRRGARRVLRRQPVTASATRSRSPRTAATCALQLWGSVYVLALHRRRGDVLITVVERIVLHWHSQPAQLTPSRHPDLAPASQPPTRSTT